MIAPHSYLGNHADNEALLFNAVRLYRVSILEDLACHLDEHIPSDHVPSSKISWSRRTGVDQLLLGDFPTFIRLNLCFEFANLSNVSQPYTMTLGGGRCTVSDSSASMTNLFCLRSCTRISQLQLHTNLSPIMLQYLECDLHLDVALEPCSEDSERG